MPYHVRVAIDCKVNVGHWYHVRGRGSEPPEIRLVKDEPDRPVSLIAASQADLSPCDIFIPPFPHSHAGAGGSGV